MKSSDLVFVGGIRLQEGSEWVQTSRLSRSGLLVFLRTWDFGTILKASSPAPGRQAWEFWLDPGFQGSGEPRLLLRWAHRPGGGASPLSWEVEKFLV